MLIVEIIKMLCCGPMLNVIMIGVIMLNVVKLSVVAKLYEAFSDSSKDTLIMIFSYKNSWNSKFEKGQKLINVFLVLF